MEHSGAEALMDAGTDPVDGTRVGVVGMALATTVLVLAVGVAALLALATG